MAGELAALQAENERLRSENDQLRDLLPDHSDAAALQPTSEDLSGVAELRFDGQVAVVTGAGSGLGRVYALLLASRGAEVVVNDLGGGVDGAGNAREPLAETVVAEIRAAGGTAVANSDSVEDGERIIACAIESFGGVHIVVNNAGIAFPASFEKLSRDQWQRMLTVHATGTFAVTQAAWPHFKEQQYGRIVVTSSPAGLFGALGAAPYCAAKLAVVGMMHGIQSEGHRHGIKVNAIAPQADTRMTREFGAMVVNKQSYEPGMATSADEDFTQQDTELGDFGPAHVAALVTWLCHEVCDSTAGEGVAPKPEHVEAGKAALLGFDIDRRVVPAVGTGNMGNFPAAIAAHLREGPRL